MGLAKVRILVVDDYEPWRHFVRSTFQIETEVRIISEVSDGLEAVWKAQELLPDLILLDIGLPALNGIEAARRIRKVAPTSTILFVSENRSVDVAEEALNTGAAGYVVKSDAAGELLPAVKSGSRRQAFCQCQFVWSRSCPPYASANHGIARDVAEVEYVEAQEHRIRSICHRSVGFLLAST